MVVLARDNCVGTNRQRNVEILTDFKAKEARWSNSNDFKLTIGECELAPNDTSIATVLTLPKGITNDYAWSRATPRVIFLRENASERRLHAEHVEKVSAYPKPFGRTYFPALGQVEAAGSPGSDP